MISARAKDAALEASDYPFRRILGIELLPVLYRVSQNNLSLQSDSQQCFAVEAMCGDARGFVFPIEPLVVYLLTLCRRPE